MIYFIEIDSFLNNSFYRTLYRVVLYQYSDRRL